MKRERKQNVIGKISLLFALALAFSVMLMQTKAMAATKITSVAFTGVTEPGVGKTVTCDISSPAGAPYSAATMTWYEMSLSAANPFDEITGYASNDLSGSDVLTWGQPEIKTFSANKLYLLNIIFDVKDGYELADDFACSVNGKKAEGTKGEDLIYMKVNNSVLIAYALDASGKLVYGDSRITSGDDSAKPSTAPSTKPSAAPSTAPSASTSQKPSASTTKKPSTSASKKPSSSASNKPASAAAAKVSTGKIEKLSPAKKKLVVKWSKDKNAKAYEVQYSLKSNMKSAKTMTVKGTSKTSTTIKGLKSKKTYYVRVRNVNGNNKGAWSKVLKAKVK